MFISPDDLWMPFIFVLIALVVIGAVYGLTFLKATNKSEAVETLAPPESIGSKIASTEAVVPNPRMPVVQVETAEETAQSDSTEEDCFYVQVIVPALRVRSSPSTEFPKIRNFVKGIIVKVKKAVENDKEIWYEIQQPSPLRYPERITGPWFIAGKYNRERLTKRIEEKVITVFPDTQPEDKWIRTNISRQTLQAFEKNQLVFETLVSTGREIRDYRTPTGNFWILKKKLSVYMQGPLPNDDDYFDLPGIPFAMYFTNNGHAIHGTYWHSDFGNRHSHGCINLPTEKSEWLYRWAEIGTPVMIVE